MSLDKTNKEYCKCKEANCFCDKAQYQEAQDWEIEQLTAHLEKCPKCQEYSKRNTKLTELCQKAKLTTLKDEEREELKELLKENLKK